MSEVVPSGRFWISFGSFVCRTPLLPVVVPTRLFLFTVKSLIKTFINPTMGRKTTTTVRQTKDGSRILESEKQIITTEVDTTCPICQEPVGKKTPEGTLEGWSELPCGHRFGSVCIKHYLHIVSEESPTCPICRQTAHHSRCGHPVLPVVLNSRNGNDSTSDTKTKRVVCSKDIQALQHTYCGYCEEIRGRWGRSKASPGKQHRRWTAPFRWLRIFDFRRPTPDPRMRVPLTPQDIIILDSNRGFPPVSWGGYPRYNNPGWELWWAKQHPTSTE